MTWEQMTTLQRLIWLKLRTAGGGGTAETITGMPPLTLPGALAKAIKSLIQFGAISQNGTPTPTSPKDIEINNGILQMVDDELPTGYKRLLGFSMNSTSYWQIPDFPLYGSDTLRFAFEASDACNIIGAYSGSASGNNYSLYVGASSNYLRYKNGAYNSSVDYNTRYDVEISPTGSSGMKVDSTWSPLEFTTPTNLCIGTTAASASSAKIKGKLYGNIEVVGRAKFIPCERISDGELGYYDTISETFYEQVSGYDGAVSLGYDGSHYELQVVGTPEVISIAGQTASAVDLFAVGNYKDEQDIITGNVTRRVGMVVLDGTETGWALSDSGTTHRFRGTKPSDCYTPASRAPIASTHFIYASAGQTQGGAFVGASTYWYFIPTDQTIDTADKWKAWLAEQYAAGTPVVVFYPLAQEKTEKVAGQRLNTTEGTNTLTVTADVYGEKSVTYAKGAAPAGYTVTISLTNPQNASDFRSCTIYEATGEPQNPYDYYSIKGNAVGSISSPTGSTTVQIGASAYGFIVGYKGAFMYIDDAENTVAGGVSYYGNDAGEMQLFSVNGDGSAIISGIDYAD